MRELPRCCRIEATAPRRVLKCRSRARPSAESSPPGPRNHVPASSALSSLGALVGPSVVISLSDDEEAVVPVPDASVGAAVVDDEEVVVSVGPLVEPPPPVAESASRRQPAAHFDCLPDCLKAPSVSRHLLSFDFQKQQSCSAYV